MKAQRWPSLLVTILRWLLVMSLTLDLLRPALAQKKDLNQILYTRRDGLSSNSVRMIEKGKDGFLWIGTVDGLNRFDGKNFDVYKNSADSNSIQANEIWDLHYSRRRGLVIGFQGGGISFFDSKRNSFKNFLPGQNNLPDKMIEEIFETSRGDLLIGIRGRGLYTLTNENRFEHLFDLPSPKSPGRDSDFNRVIDITEVDGNVWLATTSGLYLLNEGEKMPVRVSDPRDTTIYSYTSITYDQSGKLWLGAWLQGLASYDLQTGEWKKYLYSPPCKAHCFNNIVSGLAIASTDEIVLATNDNGIMKFNTITHEFQNMQEPSAPTANSIIVDTGKNLWVGLVQGLLQIKPGLNSLHQIDTTTTRFPSFVYYDTLHSLRFTVISFRDGIRVYNQKTKMNNIIPIPVPAGIADKSQIAISLVQRKNGEIFLLSKECLWQIDPQQMKLTAIHREKFLEFYSKGWFAQMLRDSDDNIWVSHSGSPKVLMVDPENTLTEIDINFPSFFQAESLDELWFSSRKEIAAYNKNTKRLQSWSVDEIPAISSRCIIQDMMSLKDTVWIATNLGLFSIRPLENGKLAAKPLNNNLGLSHKSIYSLTKDEKNDLWFIVLNVGIGRLGLDGSFNLFPLKDNNGNDISSDGYFSRLNPGVINGRTILSVSNSTGSYWFNPDSIRASNDLPILFVKESSIPGQVVESNVVTPGTTPVNGEGNVLSIFFRSIYFGDATKIRYAWRLVELDEKWKFEEASDLFLTRGNLPFDKTITLEVKISNEYYVWTTPFYIRFLIPSPIWKRGWFITLCVLTLFVGIWSFIVWRVSSDRKKALNEYKLRMRIYESEIKALRSQMNPHFIFNCLNTIQDQILQGNAAEATKYVGDFGLLLRKTLNNSDHSFIKLKEEIATIKLYLNMESIRFRDQFTWEVRVAQDLDVDLIQIPPMLIQPVLENAIHHGLLKMKGERQLTVDFFRQNGRLYCRVVDNGIGISFSQKSNSQPETRKSKGTILISDRISLLNEAYMLGGHIEVTDLANEKEARSGTRVELSFDANKLETV